MQMASTPRPTRSPGAMRSAVPDGALRIRWQRAAINDISGWINHHLAQRLNPRVSRRNRRGSRPL